MIYFKGERRVALAKQKRHYWQTISLVFYTQVDNMGVMVMATAHYLGRNIHL